jgi:hypothetical protein
MPVIFRVISANLECGHPNSPRLTAPELPCGHGVLGRYWGYLALALVVVGWVECLKVVIILVLSAAVLGYFLLQAPVWCGPITRDGRMCRNNSTGVLVSGLGREGQPFFQVSCRAGQANDDLEATVTTVTPVGNEPIALRKALTSAAGAVCGIHGQCLWVWCQRISGLSAR